MHLLFGRSRSQLRNRLRGVVQLPGDIRYQGGTFLEVGHAANQDDQHKGIFRVHDRGVVMNLRQFAGLVRYARACWNAGWYR